jgi:anionic cell wall polymer biosynthesis LytR-Cps2A-Psr (LCP) family protein
MHGIKLDQGMNYNLNGDQVLDLARARNAKGGYGLANSNFDREINQQRIINGIRAKALNVGVLADVHKAKSLLEAFGENVKTNFTWAEIGTAMDVISGLHGEVEPIETQLLYGTGNIGGQSVVVPSGANINVDSTLYNYNKIHLYLRDKLDEASEKYDDSLKSSEDDSGVETESKSEE